MRLGVVILPEHRRATAVEKWSRAEALGFDHAWTYDHVVWGALQDAPWFASVPTLAAAAMATSTIRLGTLVASPNFRHPVPFAREIVTLDDLSGGRFTLGVGAGGQGADATVLGQDEWSVRERLDRFGEFVDLLDRLLTIPDVTFDGKYWSAREAKTHPGCVQRPRVPFAIAASAPRSMQVAAEYASVWVTNGDRSYRGTPLSGADGAAVVARQLRMFEEACDAAGRDHRSIDKLVLTGPRLDAGLQSLDAFRAVVDAYAGVGVTDLVVHWPRPDAPYAGDEAILESIASARRAGDCRA